MSATDIFEDYDTPEVYETLQQRLLAPNVLNFVVEFGADEAKIAFDLDGAKVDRWLNHNEPPRDAGRPVRWINVWGPNLQPGMMDVLATRYGFSHRLKAILKSPPFDTKEENPNTAPQAEPAKANGAPKTDVEHANGVTEKTVAKAPDSEGDATHYKIARSLINYQSLDLGEEFLCVGANWMYRTKTKEMRLWSWLILCDDATVISLHEDAKPANSDAEYQKAVRGHVINVLNQLSTNGFTSGGSMFLASARMILKGTPKQANHGFEGSSNLFYYLFENWHGTYELIVHMQKRLHKLSGEILGGLERKHQKEPNKYIIPELYKIGKQLRTNQHLYESYQSIIERILNFKAGSNTQNGKRVAVALTASERFERLADRIKLLVLSSINEAISEKDALLNTYFQITTQRDSAATAKLSRNATLLSKLGVLFLPVSLMTSYFSVQIDDLQGVYTSETYWVCFAVIMFLSFIALFFLSRVLMTITESLEARVHRSTRWFRMHLGRQPPDAANN